MAEDGFQAEEEAWAHVRLDPTTGQTFAHLLEDHLFDVATGAANAAASFGAADWAYLAGLWHDLGKYRIGFRRYIRRANDPDAHIEGRIKDRDKTHSAAGALWAERILTDRFGPKGRLMARALQYVIAGHHAGLDNWEGGLSARLAHEDALTECEQALAAHPPEALLRPDCSSLSLNAIPFDEPGGIPGRFALWLRMLFSALVDADFLDTESFMNDARGRLRAGGPSLNDLKPALDAHLRKLTREVADIPVNRVRTNVLAQCREKASRSPGVFTLSVPTGGGKTLSSLSFAVDHAVRHGHRRVVYAIPYTSIIEQTADVFRAVFEPLGADSVVEHHSNVDSDPSRETARSRLACENWDAPLIVTTNVQLFESLFAHRTSRCRKLHNLARSVIVLDEAQLLPVEFLQPVIDVLQLLVRDFGVTLLLCTATQPVLSASASTDPRHGLQRGFEPSKVTEIIDDVPALYAALERVHVHVPASLEEARSWTDLAAEIAARPAALTIVSRRADARELFALLSSRLSAEDAKCWHLSALMCAQHRSDVIAEIKAALKRRRKAMDSGKSVPRLHIVSTQLVEAGVDLDLPVVYRALAGLDSIAQAAGRCNREGLLADKGEMHVFVPPSAAPPGLLRQARDACKAVWSERGHQEFDPLDRSLIERYFRRLYHDVPSLDTKSICRALRLEADRESGALAVRFRDAAKDFRLIEDKDAATVVVRYSSADSREDINSLIGLLERDGPSRWLMRKLQRYTVTIYRHHLDFLVRDGDIREIPLCPGLFVQVEGRDDFYDSRLGANVTGAPGDPASVVV